MTDADPGRLSERLIALTQRVEHLEVTYLPTNVGDAVHQQLVDRVASLEASQERQRVNQRQMLGLLIGGVITFLGTTIVALLNHFH